MTTASRKTGAAVMPAEGAFTTGRKWRKRLYVRPAFRL
jgi:hypothetical protein